jgi:hypothetical protein
MELFPALIKEGQNGAYYRVKLAALPNKGDRITLFSHVDTQDKNPANHAYEVLGVIHEVHDCPVDDPRHAAGYHAVTIVVKPISPAH